jgi:hypothetical protein
MADSYKHLGEIMFTVDVYTNKTKAAKGMLAYQIVCHTEQEALRQFDRISRKFKIADVYELFTGRLIISTDQQPN